MPAGLPILQEPTFSSCLVDDVGRRMRKLRVSLTDACDFRCVYCMPEDMRFMPKRLLMSADEIVALVSPLVDAGIEEIRLTGGEPALRADLVDIAARLSALPIRRLGITSNGRLLRHHLAELRSVTRLSSINVSLDTLQRERFRRITRRDAFDDVMECILQARDLGFEVKVNCVAQPGVNDDELLDFVAFASESNVEVRFLEMMNIGVAHDQSEVPVLSAAAIRAALSTTWELSPIAVEADSTAQRMLLRRRGHRDARIGIIASETESFCSECSRLRLSATGVLRPCLMTNTGTSLRGLPPAAFAAVVAQVVRQKPLKRLASIDQPMVSIGG